MVDPIAHMLHVWNTSGIHQHKNPTKDTVLIGKNSIHGASALGNILRLEHTMTTI